MVGKQVESAEVVGFSRVLNTYQITAFAAFLDY